jgi:HAAS domain-containing protein
MTEPIEDYLDDLQGRLRGTPRQIRRTLREAEDHLHDAAAAGIERGLTPLEAQRAAVADFGDATDIARRCNASTGQLVRSLMGQAAALVAVGLIAIGISGVIAQIMVATGGRVFTFGDRVGTFYPPADCSHWLGLHPHAVTCAQAALDENISDGLLQRFAAGVLGLLLLVALTALSRRTGASPGRLLTRPLAAVVGATAFGAATVILFALGGSALQVDSGHGAGQWLSAAGVSAVAAACFALITVRRLRELPTLAR